MVGEAKPCDGVVFPIRAENEGVQQNVHASRGADFVESALDRLRIKYHEDAAVARGRRHCAPAAELGHDFIGNAGHGLTRLLTECVESAIGQHIAHRPGAAEASGGFKQPNACAGLGCANCSPYACSASTDNENVILVFCNHRNHPLSEGFMISIAGNLVAPVQRKKALVSGSVFVNREEWIRSLRCAPSLPSRKREASVLLRRSSISCPRSSPSASRSSSGSWARRCFTVRPARSS